MANINTDTPQSMTQQASNRLVGEEEVDIEFLEDDDDETENETAATAATGNSKKRKAVALRSPMWNYFTPEYLEEGDPPVTVRKGKCNKCGTLIAAHSRKNGTTGMRHHLASCEKKHASNAGQTILSYQPSASGDGTGSLTPWHFDQKAARDALCEMIIIDELPFRFIEHEGFKRFMARVCLQFLIPTRKTIREDCVKLFINQKDKIKSFFKIKGMGRISITTDSWTAINNTNFICITAHFIAKDWKLHKKIISFRKIVSHKGDDICTSVMASLNEWDLKNIMCCTMDNAATNDVAVRNMSTRFDISGCNILEGKYLHMRCVAHIINLIVSDGLEEIGMSVRRVREAVKHIKASPSRLEQFNSCVQALKIDCKRSLCLDVATRWNSTYLMLESAEPYEAAIKFYGTMNPSFEVDLADKKHRGESIGHPVEADWVNVRKMIEYLKRFYDLTLLVSGTSYVSSHLFFKEMCDVFEIITELELSDDDDVSFMANRMRKKVEKYWSEAEELNPKFNRILYIAALLDPRQKMKHLEKCLKKVYGIDRGAELVSEIKSSMTELFEFYKKQVTPIPTPRSNAAGTSSSVLTERRSDRRGSCSTLQDSSDEETDNIDTSEMTIYFTEKQFREPKRVSETDVDVDKFDILQWWSTHGIRFPILSEMARDVLAIPISTVASESAFSTGGRILDDFRSSLNPDMVEALICAEDWLRNNKMDLVDAEDVPEEELEKEYESVLRSIVTDGARSAESGIAGTHLASKSRLFSL